MEKLNKEIEDTTQENREIIPESKVGLSLSYCVSDILNGKIKEEEVKMIITGTNISIEEWDELLEDYKKRYWKKDPEEGAAIACRLYKAGKIKQSRQEEGKFEPDIAGRHWIKTDEMVNWEKEQADRDKREAKRKERQDELRKIDANWEEEQQAK